MAQIIKNFALIKWKGKHLDTIEQENEEANDLKSLLQARFKYVVIVHSNDKIYKVYEGDHLSKVDYPIYSKYCDSTDKLDIYIKDNERNIFMLIEKDKESESMFAADHPEQGFIGYLRFEYVENI